MSTMIGRERSLQKAFAPILEDYDFICIDTPPSLGLLTINALTAADKVIVPVQCEYLSMRGLIQLQNTLAMIRENLNPGVDIEGILPDLGGLAHDPRQGGDRDPRGKLRRSRVRLAHPQDRPLRGGAGEGHVGAQVRAGWRRRPVLPATRAGGSHPWPIAKRASMREGPLAALFRKTEEAPEQAAASEQATPRRPPPGQTAAEQRAAAREAPRQSAARPRTLARAGCRIPP